jgi:hypothetical protein
MTDKKWNGDKGVSIEFVSLHKFFLSGGKLNCAI